MKKNRQMLPSKSHINLFFVIFSFLWAVFTYAQNQQFPGIPEFKAPVPSPLLGSFNQPSANRNQPQLPTPIYPQRNNYTERQYRAEIQNVERNEALRTQSIRDMESDIEQHLSALKYNFPSHYNKEGAKLYYDTFKAMQSVDPDNYSIKDINFGIENAFTANTENKAEFDKIIKETGQFLKAKMKELGYDSNSNLAKNYILFQFFSETLQLKATGQKHFPFKYDFNDYMGKKDWSNMFVSKLIRSGTGQCHSMPILYLILAEEIGAVSYLSFSPNHSYIKFQDERNKWYNLELTNGMFTTDSFILNSGFIKSEALQNQIYMQPLSKRQLLSQSYVDLAAGYFHKYGYDQFVEVTLNMALELYPNNINANKLKANYYTDLLFYVTRQLGINPEKREELVKIKDNPAAMAILIKTQQQYRLMDESGFEYMPADAYEKWLQSLNNEKNRQNNETFSKQFKGLLKTKVKQ